MVTALCDLICQLPWKQVSISVGVAFDVFVETKLLRKAQGEEEEKDLCWEIVIGVKGARVKKPLKSYMVS